MIFPLTNKHVKVRQMGAMRRVQLKEPIVPEISPALQGSAAYNLLDDNQKGMLEYALADAAKMFKYDVNQLNWSFGKKVNGIAPLSIKPPKRITIIERIKRHL